MHNNIILPEIFPPILLLQVHVISVGASSDPIQILDQEDLWPETDLSLSSVSVYMSGIRGDVMDDVFRDLYMKCLNSGA